MGQLIDERELKVKRGRIVRELESNCLSKTREIED